MNYQSLYKAIADAEQTLRNAQLYGVALSSADELLLNTLSRAEIVLREHPSMAEEIGQFESADIESPVLDAEPLTDAERGAAKSDFDAMMRDALRDFFANTGIAKSDFAQVYGCSPSYLSRILSGEKNPDFAVLIRTFEAFRFRVRMDTVGKKIHVER